MYYWINHADPIVPIVKIVAAKVTRKIEPGEEEMKILGRIALILLGLVLVILIISIVAGFTAVRRPFPQTDGEITLDGPKGTIHIYRDEFGIPHIYANNQDDLFFAQGYVHAQDRFWQMELFRHFGQGRIAEIAGEAAVEQDKYIRTIGWNRMAADTLTYFEEEAPEYMAIMDAYSDGRQRLYQPTSR